MTIGLMPGASTWIFKLAALLVSCLIYLSSGMTASLFYFKVAMPSLLVFVWFTLLAIELEVNGVSAAKRLWLSHGIGHFLFGWAVYGLLKVPLPSFWLPPAAFHSQMSMGLILLVLWFGWFMAARLLIAVQMASFHVLPNLHRSRVWLATTVGTVFDLFAIFPVMVTISMDTYDALWKLLSLGTVKGMMAIALVPLLSLLPIQKFAR